MPELPEVQTVVNGIKSKLIGLKVTNTEVFVKKLRYPVPINLKNKINKSSLLSVERRAKYIIFTLSNDYSLIIHLGMSGRIIIGKKKEIKSIKHTHFQLYFSYDLVLQFIDPRRFGCVLLRKTSELLDEKLFKHLGVEPLDKPFNQNYLYEITRNKASPIKSIIMNQKYVVGIGNIYASESLHISKISPLKKASKITKAESDRLVRSIKTVLKKSIQMGGSSINDHTMISGKLGHYQNKLQVYGRDGKKCRNKSCQLPILRIVIAQRSTFYCSSCQK
tara:strand:+ start:968 stop:1798 length:831 start_codon:yes stop_codon:yes gene_type:complete